VAPVDEHHQSYGFRPAEVEQGRKCCPCRAAGVDDVVDKQDGPSVDVEPDLGAAHDRCLSHELQVVTVQGDVNCADRHVARPFLHQPCSQSVGQGHAPALDTNQGDVLFVLVPGRDICRQPVDEPVQLGRVDDLLQVPAT
jgi:hypothetical protein